MKKVMKRTIIFSFMLMVVFTCHVVSAYSNTRKYTDSEKRCSVWGCNNLKCKGSYYCSDHKCAVYNCTAKKSSDGIYCEAHHKEFFSKKSNWTKSSKSSGTVRSSSKTTGKSATKKSDPYEVYSYDDPEDFYFDWEEDFDGYEDAEEYWEDAWD